MSKKNNLSMRLRVYHRYLGFFLAGIMAVYAVSGVVLIFRPLDFMKHEVHQVRTMATGLSDRELGEQLKLRDLHYEQPEGDIRHFKQGTYNVRTGVADYREKKYGLVMEKLTHLHMASTRDPLYYLNVFFGLGLLFFVVSAFFMFLPGTNVFRKGLYFALAGAVLVVVLLFV